MGWNVEIKTAHGDETLYFDQKSEAEDALNEAKAHISSNTRDPVTIAGQYVVRARDIRTARMYESGL
jgi:hypothetical protein